MSSAISHLLPQQDDTGKNASRVDRVVMVKPSSWHFASRNEEAFSRKKLSSLFRKIGNVHNISSAGVVPIICVNVFAKLRSSHSHAKVHSISALPTYPPVSTSQFLILGKSHNNLHNFNIHNMEPGYPRSLA